MKNRVAQFTPILKNSIIITLLCTGTFVLAIIIILPEIMYKYESKFPIHFDYVAEQYISLGQLTEVEQVYKRAIQSFSKGVVDVPNLSASYYALAQLYMQQKRFQESITIFQKILSLNYFQMNLLPIIPTTYMNIGKSYLMVQDLDRATFNFKIAYNLDSNLKQSILNMYLDYLKNNRGKTEVALKVADIFIFSGNFNDAFTVLKGVEKDSLEKDILFGKLYFYKKDYKNSTTYFEQVINKDPSSLQNYFYLLYSYENLEMKDKIQFIKNAINEKFKIIGTYNTLRYSVGNAFEQNKSWLLNRIGYGELGIIPSKIKNGKIWIVAKGDAIIDVWPLISVQVDDKEVTQWYISSNMFFPYEVDLSTLDIIKESKLHNFKFYFTNNAYSKTLFESRKVFIQTIYTLK